MTGKVYCSTKAVIEKDGKFLIIKEKCKGKDIIDLPGGKIEFGSSPEKTLVREIKEELFLDIKIEKLIGVWYFFGFVGGDQIICITYLCKPLSNKIDLTKNPAKNENIFEYKWVTPEEFLKLKQPHIKEDFERLKKFIRNYYFKKE